MHASPTGWIPREDELVGRLGEDMQTPPCIGFHADPRYVSIVPGDNQTDSCRKHDERTKPSEKIDEGAIDPIPHHSGIV